MNLRQRAHEWAADHVSFVQYPHIRPLAREQRREDWVTKALKWGLFAWLMWLIWSGVALVVVIVAITLLGPPGNT